jgi:hypothetical protein
LRKKVKEIISKEVLAFQHAEFGLKSLVAAAKRPVGKKGETTYTW